MSMTLSDMATEVAKTIGAHNTAVSVDLATRAIKASIRDWQAAREWNFLLKDTAAGFRITYTLTTSQTLTAPASPPGTFDAINVGQTVTVVSGTGTIPANTTVSSVSRNYTTGIVESITISAAPTAGASVLNFSGDIPIIQGTNEYNLPVDFSSPYNARLLTNRRLLEYIKYREWNIKIIDQTTQGSVDAYTIYNPVSPQTQNYGTYRMRVFRTPAASDTIHLQYYRMMDPDATTVDIPNDYLDMLMDYAAWRFLKLKDTEDTRLPHFFEVAKNSLAMAIADDDENSEEEQLRLISQMEAWANGANRPLWTNGAFWPTMMDY